MVSIDELHTTSPLVPPAACSLIKRLYSSVLFMSLYSTLMPGYNASNPWISSRRLGVGGRVNHHLAFFLRAVDQFLIVGGVARREGRIGGNGAQQGDCRYGRADFFIIIIHPLITFNKPKINI